MRTFPALLALLFSIPALANPGYVPQCWESATPGLQDGIFEIDIPPAYGLQSVEATPAFQAIQEIIQKSVLSMGQTRMIRSPQGPALLIDLGPALRSWTPSAEFPSREVLMRDIQEALMPVSLLHAVQITCVRQS